MIPQFQIILPFRALSRFVRFHLRGKDFAIASSNPLRAYIANSSLMNDNVEDVTFLMDNYNSVLSTLLDKHAPIKERVVTVRPAAPWYMEVIIGEKRMLRRLERRWRGSRLSVDREMYVKQYKVVNERIYQSKMRYYSGII